MVIGACRYPFAYLIPCTDALFEGGFQTSSTQDSPFPNDIGRVVSVSCSKPLSAFLVSRLFEFGSQGLPTNVDSHVKFPLSVRYVYQRGCLVSCMPSKHLTSYIRRLAVHSAAVSSPVPHLHRFTTQITDQVPKNEFTSLSQGS